jgi:hypothetical protein
MVSMPVLVQRRYHFAESMALVLTEPDSEHAAEFGEVARLAS